MKIACLAKFTFAGLSVAGPFTLSLPDNCHVSPDQYEVLDAVIGVRWYTGGNQSTMKECDY